MTARIIPSPALATALDAYGAAFCRAAHLDNAVRRAALEAAEQALLAVIEAYAERALSEGIAAGEVERAALASDDGPRLHIPRDLLTRGSED